MRESAGPSMSVVLAVVPFVAAAVAALWRLRREAVSRRLALIVAAVLVGGVVVLAAETLSLFGALTRPSLVLFWAAAIPVVWMAASWTARLLPRDGASYDAVPPSTKLLCAGLGVYAAATLAVALAATPNSWDSLTYHPPRVHHWIQDHTVAHYPTHVERQVDLGPWAELAILHLRLLVNDRFDNLVQWLAMIGSVLTVSLAAGLLGAGREGQVYAAVFCATIPIGILEATSTQNDYVVAFWLACFLTLLLVTPMRHQAGAAVLAGLALGLAWLKGTAYVYSAPLLVWCTHRRGIKGTVLAASFAALLGAGHYGRNLAASGSPLGPGYVMWPDRVLYANEEVSPRTLLSNAVRGAVLHLGLPNFHALTSSRGSTEPSSEPSPPS